jgi:aspartate kinase
MKIGNVDISSQFILAPMAAVNCTAFRMLCKENNAGLVYTQMFDVELVKNKNRREVKDLLNITESERPVSVQLIGNNEESILKSMKLVEEFADIIDFNVGCSEKEILAQGELLSTHLFTHYLQEQHISCHLIPALDFMSINMFGEPISTKIEADLTKILNQYPEQKLFITQGFICRNEDREIDNLQRGGSDYSASLIGVAVNADEIQIWTDISGMHNNDPRFVQNTKPVPHLCFEEAAELAYFGAKILHPTCILPAKDKNIRVRLLNTMDPKAEGTLISNDVRHSGIAAIAAKDGITSIKIKSGRMLLAYGFLRKVFQIFEDFQTPIDLVTTSEVGVSVTIDNDKHLNEIQQKLEEFGTVFVEKNMTIICVVGQIPADTVGLQSKVLQAFQNIPVRMVSYGGSNYNISFIVRSEDKINALQTLHNTLFI